MWHHHVILSKCKTIEEAEFYVKQTIQNNWSRNILEIQISSKLINRLGKAPNNFELTLPKPQKKVRKLDLLFYHLKMHCYVVIDLKMVEFEPEFAGKMNYYLSAVDDLLKSDIDQPSIGIILCKSKDNLDVEYALRDINKPMGISEFSFNELPPNIQKNMPTVEELENEFKNFET